MVAIRGRCSQSRRAPLIPDIYTQCGWSSADSETSPSVSYECNWVYMSNDRLGRTGS